MEICVKCFFDNKSEFEKALNYLKPIVDGNIDYSGQVSREAVYNRIAYLIGIFGASYHPDDNVRDLAPEGSSYEYLTHLEVTQNDIDYMCDVLGLDPCAIALEVLTDLGINPLEN